MAACEFVKKNENEEGKAFTGLQQADCEQERAQGYIEEGLCVCPSSILSVRCQSMNPTNSIHHGIYMAYLFKRFSSLTQPSVEVSQPEK